MTELRRPGLADFAARYRAGDRDPVQVARSAIEAIRASDFEQPALRAVISIDDAGADLAAAAAAERWRAGAPRSPLDGVPVLIKDNLDLAGLPTTNGTRLDFPVPRDARVVQRLRDAGAVVLGKANMHEIGAGTTGINPHHGTARNPYDDGRWCGGSSSGSACAVGAGLVPLAIGTDAGGSIRAPAAFCGAVGLKPTFGRISRLGMSILCDTVDHIGPIATSCLDAAHALVATAGVEPDDSETWDQPPLPGHAELPAILDRGVAGLRIGLDRGLLDHRLVDPGVAARVEAAAAALSDAGAQLIDVELPDPEQSLLVGLVVLGAEGPSGLEELLHANRRRLGADIQVLLAVGAHFSARDYLKAQRMRERIKQAWDAVLDRADYVLLPAAGIPAGPIHRDAEICGEIDQTTSERAIGQTFPSNLTGYPAVSVPAGYVDELPVSAQIVGRAWDELGVLRVGAALERAALFSPRRPARYYGDRLL